MFKLYEVDPEADTLLIVPHPSRPFAPWKEPGSSETTPTTPSDIYAGILRGTSRPPNIYASIASAPELRVKVSSQHLVLASKHFRNRFRYPRPRQDDDDNGDSSDGRTHISLAPGYDPQAVLTVMDIIHGRGRKVPRELPDVEALAKVAVVVDAFKFHDAVEVYAERWIAGLLRGAAPAAERLGEATDERELILWIYASYVFRQAEVFKAATRIAVLRSDGPIPSLGLQVREGVIREIESRRQQAISAALDVVHAALDALQQDESPCALGCDTFLLGALTKSLRRAKLPFFVAAQPPAATPLLGIRALDVSRAVNEAQGVLARQFAASSSSSFGPSWGLLPMTTTTSRKHKMPNAPLTPESSPEPERGFRGVHTCEAREGNIGTKLEELERGVEGLELESKLGYYLY